MKNMFESSEVFTAYATIAAAYYEIGLINEQLEKMKYQSPIERMVYEATGYDKHKTMEMIDITISILEDIVEQKKFIEDESYKEDTQHIVELNKIKIKS